VVIRWQGRNVLEPRELDRIAELGGVSAAWLLDGGEGRGKRRDRQWEEAVSALRVAWGDRRRREALLLVLRAVAGDEQMATRELAQMGAAKGGGRNAGTR
jgi:hypothetical protein